jgi:hypothetical protein
VQCFPGLSQYSQVFNTTGDSRTGSSACGLACFNCARIVFTKEQNGIRGTDLLTELLEKQTFEVNNYVSIIDNNLV